MSGCDYLIHVASPIALDTHNEDFFVKPAVAGVNRALTFAKKHNIKKLYLHLLLLQFSIPWRKKVTTMKVTGLIQKTQQ